MAGTKDRLLDAAESLFAEQGVGATSLRQIIHLAAVNLAAVHYHFGSKEELIEAVILRRLRPLNAERLTRLDRAEAANQVDLETILEAFLAPTLALARDPDCVLFIRIMGRLHVDSELLPRLIARHFPEIIDRFYGALQRALPDLPGEELRWRTFFSIGAVAHTMVAGGRCPLLGADEPPDHDALLERLVTYIACGLRAPVREVRHAA